MKIDVSAEDLVVNGRGVLTFRNNGFRVPIGIWVGAKPSGPLRVAFAVDAERYRYVVGESLAHPLEV